MRISNCAQYVLYYLSLAGLIEKRERVVCRLVILQVGMRSAIVQKTDALHKISLNEERLQGKWQRRNSIIVLSETLYLFIKIYCF